MVNNVASIPADLEAMGEAAVAAYEEKRNKKISWGQVKTGTGTKLVTTSACVYLMACPFNEDGIPFNCVKPTAQVE